MKIEDYFEAVNYIQKCESCGKEFEEADWLPYPEMLSQIDCVDCMSITPEQEQLVEESLNQLKKLLGKEPQQGEFIFPPASHKHDPSTSKEAEKRITRSGERKSHADLVLALVVASPGRTATEIGEQLWPDDLRGQIGKARRRLSDLKTNGDVYSRILVAEDGKKETESRWWPTKRGEYDN